jgi:hypothetical protein
MVASIMGIILTTAKDIVALHGPIGGKLSRTLTNGPINYSTKGLDSSGSLIELLIVITNNNNKRGFTQ